jgi:predicted transcriptional regulator
MDVDAVPQEGNRTLGGHRRAMYARDAGGDIVIVPSRGGEVDETVALQALERIHEQTEEAKERVLAGRSSPLEYWMYAQRLDLSQLSQVTGFWQWRIRRHLRPDVFASLPPKILQRYAWVMGITVEQLVRLP